MAILERDVVLQGMTKEGDTTMDFPITRLANVEDTADVKESPIDEDYIPIIDSSAQGQMKKFTFQTLKNILSKIFAAINHNMILSMQQRHIRIAMQRQIIIMIQYMQRRHIRIVMHQQVILTIMLAVVAQEAQLLLLIK